MKNLIKLFILLIPFSIFSQNTPWVEEGNSSTVPSQDYLGTDDNNQLIIRTNDFIRTLIRAGDDDNADGFVAMGADLPYNFEPLERLHLIDSAAGEFI